ncbi:UNVERIFIED_CONTAM: hypothetical protein H355_004564, partial [Colinus virginianus]
STEVWSDTREAVTAGPSASRSGLQQTYMFLTARYMLNYILVQYGISTGDFSFSAASKEVFSFFYSCSICTKKQNRHFIVPASRFKLLKGADNLTTYTFNTHRAQHTFCRTCGVQSFYTPRSNPDGYGIAPHCLDDGTVHSIVTEDINGKEWEKAMKEHKTIRDMSKP